MGRRERKFAFFGNGRHVEEVNEEEGRRRGRRKQCVLSVREIEEREGTEVVRDTLSGSN